MKGILEGKVALITGASGEIGHVTALELSQENALGIALHYNRDQRRASEIAGDVEKYGSQALTLQADLSKPNDAKKLVTSTLSEFGKLDILICLAGYPFLRKDWFNNFEKLSSEQFKKPLKVDLLGNIYVAQAAIPAMKKRRSGKIIFTGSTPALTGDVVGITYLIAKAGLLALTRSLAQYLGPYNIHVNAIALGSIDTKTTIRYLENREKEELLNETSLKRFGKPIEVAKKIVFLSSDSSNYVTGQTLIIDGGYAMR